MEESKENNIQKMTRRGSGSIFKPKYKTKNGTVRESRFFYVQFYRDGIRYVENTHTDKITPAKEFLKKRLGSENFIPPQVEKVRFEEIAADLITDYEKEEKRSIAKLRRSVRYLTKFFRGHRAAGINGAMISEYAVLRKRKPQEEDARDGLSTGASVASVNRELAALRRMFNIAKKNGKVRFIPSIELSRENNVRKGFLEHDQFRALQLALPDYARPVLVAMYYTGMRIGEVLAIQWEQVDLFEREIRLEPGTTKNDEARTLPIDGELFELIQAQQRLHHEKYPNCPWVFSHHGKPIRNLYRAWRASCVEVGLAKMLCVTCSTEIKGASYCVQCSNAAQRTPLKYVGLIPHDLRRTGVRNLVRAGVPRSVAMKISGHKTEAVFERYNITSQRDLREAARRLTTYLDEKNDKSTTKVNTLESLQETTKDVSLIN
jgi:integrase